MNSLGGGSTARRSGAVVLHERNLAARCLDRIKAMKHGGIVTAGPPEEVNTDNLLARVFDPETTIITDPDTTSPSVLIDRKLAA